jgi:flagellar FliJ protein
MTIGSLEALNTLREREQAERDRALALLRDAQSQADHAQAQAEQLRQYRAEYAQRWTSQFRQQGTMELVQCYQSFMQRLEQAVAQQAALAEQSRVRVDAQRDLLRECELRLASVCRLIERREHQQRRLADRAEQRASDETAQRAHERRQAETRARPQDTSWMM